MGLTYSLMESLRGGSVIEETTETKQDGTSVVTKKKSVALSLVNATVFGLVFIMWIDGGNGMLTRVFSGVCRECKNAK
jgi:hypothetical protein